MATTYLQGSELVGAVGLELRLAHALEPVHALQRLRRAACGGRQRRRPAGVAVAHRGFAGGVGRRQRRAVRRACRVEALGQGCAADLAHDGGGLGNGRERRVAARGRLGGRARPLVRLTRGRHHCCRAQGCLVVRPGVVGLERFAGHFHGLLGVLERVRRAVALPVPPEGVLVLERGQVGRGPRQPRLGERPGVLDPLGRLARREEERLHAPHRRRQLAGAGGRGVEELRVVGREVARDQVPEVGVRGLGGLGGVSGRGGDGRGGRT